MVTMTEETDNSSGDLTNSNHGIETLTHGLESGKSLEKSNECSVRLPDLDTYQGPPLVWRAMQRVPLLWPKKDFQSIFYPSLSNCDNDRQE